MIFAAQQAEGSKMTSIRDQSYTQRPFGGFARSVRLPLEAKVEEVEATRREGVLTVRVSQPADLREIVRRLEVDAAVRQRVHSGVSGKRIVVVEDQPLVALELATSLTDAGCIVIGPVGTVAEAKRLIGEAQFDGVLLDVKLTGGSIDEVAAMLARRNAPFAFVTASARDDLPAAVRGAPLLAKPFAEKELLATVGRLFHSVDASVRSRSRRP